MYICICNKVTDRQIRNIVEQGASDLRQVSDELNVGKCCGRCTDCAKKVVFNALDELWQQEPVPAIA